MSDPEDNQAARQNDNEKSSKVPNWRIPDSDELKAPTGPPGNDPEEILPPASPVPAKKPNDDEKSLEAPGWRMPDSDEAKTPTERPEAKSEETPRPEEPVHKEKRKKPKRGKDAIPIGVLGFSASGKTVFLSMLYHATAEVHKFQDGWRAQWTEDDNGATARHLRDVGHSILGLLRSGKPDWKDRAHKKVRRELPAGTIPGERHDLRFSLTRSWGLTEFSMSFCTIDGSGESIHNAFLDGIENLDGVSRDDWEEVAELCRSSAALFLFVNVLNVHDIQNSGEMRMLLEWILRQKHHPKVVAVVVTGIDVLDDQHHILATKQEIEKKYELIFEMLENSKISYRLFMVSSLGNHIVRKKTEGMDPGCMGAQHRCPRCQELVDDPKVTAEPIAIAEPFEYIFHKLLPWYHRWLPMSIAVGILSKIRRTLFSKITFLLFLVALGCLYWKGESPLYEHIQRMTKNPNSSPIEIEWTGFAYTNLYRNNENHVSDVCSEVAPWKDLQELLKYVRTSKDPEPTKEDALKAFRSKYPDTAVATRARKELVLLELHRWIRLITQGSDYVQRCANVTGAMAVSWPEDCKDDYKRQIRDNATELVDEIIEQYPKRVTTYVVDNSDSDKGADNGETISKELERIQGNIESWKLDNERMASLTGMVGWCTASIDKQLEGVRDARLWKSVNASFVATEFVDAHKGLSELQRRRTDNSERVKAFLHACDLGMKGFAALESNQWNRARECFERVREIVPEPVGESAYQEAMKRFREKKELYETNVAREQCDRAREAYNKEFEAQEIDKDLFEEFAAAEWQRIKTMVSAATNATNRESATAKEYADSAETLRQARTQLCVLWPRIERETESWREAKGMYEAQLEDLCRNAVKRYAPVTWKNIADLERKAETKTEDVEQRTAAYKAALGMLHTTRPAVIKGKQGDRRGSERMREKCLSRFNDINENRNDRELIDAHAPHLWTLVCDLKDRGAEIENIDPGGACEDYSKAVFVLEGIVGTVEATRNLEQERSAYKEKHKQENRNLAAIERWAERELACSEECAESDRGK